MIGCSYVCVCVCVCRCVHEYVCVCVRVSLCELFNQNKHCRDKSASRLSSCKLATRSAAGKTRFVVRASIDLFSNCKHLFLQKWERFCRRKVIFSHSKIASCFCSYESEVVPAECMCVAGNTGFWQLQIVYFVAATNDCSCNF